MKVGANHQVSLNTYTSIIRTLKCLNYMTHLHSLIEGFSHNFLSLHRLESVATDAELDDKSSEDLTRLADILHNSCIKAVAEYEDKLKEDPNFDGRFY